MWILSEMGHHCWDEVSSVKGTTLTSTPNKGFAAKHQGFIARSEVKVVRLVVSTTTKDLHIATAVVYNKQVIPQQCLCQSMVSEVC